eukprot:TRINITY_DN16229_c0_g3_i1.p2 TRINITY_DN16229_c0_g3~~TRINITY_DN16229_c0_g3_i1.p2  ORF type:complete len:393 (+),score=41.09 TRINITY_DN16229_c0_g3_i1:91-1269(+)
MIKKAYKLDYLFTIASKNYDNLNGVHVAAIFTQLAKMWSNPGSGEFDEIMRNKVKDLAISRFWEVKRELAARQISQIVWAAGKMELRQKDEDFVDAVIEIADECVGQFKIMQACIALSGMTSLSRYKHNTYVKILREVDRELSSSRSAQIKPMDITSLVQSTAILNPAKHHALVNSLFSRLSFLACNCIYDFTPTQLANIGQLYTSNGKMDVQLLDSILSAAMKTYDRFELDIDTSGLLWTLARGQKDLNLNEGQSELIRTLVDRICPVVYANLERYNDIDMCRVIYSLGSILRSQQKSSTIFSEFSKAVRSKAQRFSIHQLMLIVSGFVQANHDDSRLYNHLIQVCVSKIGQQGADVEAAVTLARLFTRVGVYDRVYFEGLCDSIVSDWNA